MGQILASMVGVDISPRFHPQYGARGTTPRMTELHRPLLARCLVLEQDDRQLIWYGGDLNGEPIPFTDALRDELAGRLGVPRSQIAWSSSQSHACGALPGSIMSGSHIENLIADDPEFIEAERQRFFNDLVSAAQQAIETLQPVQLWAGRGFCDSIGYNSRFPMPTGGCKFSRDWAEGVQGGKFYDPTVSLLRFEDASGKPLGVIFNFCCHPAVLIMQECVSPDWVGAARQCIEDALDGAPAMFVQGFCGDVHPRHMFGTPEQADRLGERLGKTAVRALATLNPVRCEPFDFVWRTVELPCQPMPTRQECEGQIALREAYIEEVLGPDPQACWCAGFNFPDPGRFSPEMRADVARLSILYYQEAIRMLEAGEEPRKKLDITVGGLRLGDVGVAFSPGENFTITGDRVRQRSPFAHTLICGDTNGLFGYMGTDEEIERGGFETDAFWKCLEFEGMRLPPAQGTAGQVAGRLGELLRELHAGSN